MKLRIMANHIENFTVIAKENDNQPTIYLAFSYTTLVGVAIIQPDTENTVMVTNRHYSKTTIKHCKEFAKISGIPYSDVHFVNPEALATWNL